MALQLQPSDRGNPFASIAPHSLLHESLGPTVAVAAAVAAVAVVAAVAASVALEMVLQILFQHSDHGNPFARVAPHSLLYQNLGPTVAVAAAAPGQFIAPLEPAVAVSPALLAESHFSTDCVPAYLKIFIHGVDFSSASTHIRDCS